MVIILMKMVIVFMIMMVVVAELTVIEVVMRTKMMSMIMMTPSSYMSGPDMFKHIYHICIYKEIYMYVYVNINIHIPIYIRKYKSQAGTLWQVENFKKNSILRNAKKGSRILCIPETFVGTRAFAQIIRVHHLGAKMHIHIGSP